MEEVHIISYLLESVITSFLKHNLSVVSHLISQNSSQTKSMTKICTTPKRPWRFTTRDPLYKFKVIKFSEKTSVKDSCKKYKVSYQQFQTWLYRREKITSIAWDTAKMWKRAALAVILACAVSVMIQTPMSTYHNALASLGNTFPFVNSLGEYFHDSSSAGKSTTGTTKTDLKSQGDMKNHDWMTGPRSDLKMLNDEDIKYTDGGKFFLVIIGHVFDVSEGKSYYKPDSGYFGFIGQDASRAFVSGQFDKEGLISDVSGLTSSDYKGLAEWLKFYIDHDQYVHVGYHVGVFFDENGKETDYMNQFKGWVNEAKKEEDAENDLKKIFPPCNVDWNAESGTTFHCTSLSGGIDRDWVGVPRQFFQEGSTTARCACVHPNYLADPRIKQYENCDAKSEQCKLPK